MSDLFKQLSDSMAQAVAAVSPSIVRVEGRSRLAATGIVYSPDVIVTANHVVEQEDNIVIGLHDGTTAHARLVGRDPANDLAALRVEGGKMQPVVWGDNNSLRVGHLVLAVGRPTEQLQATLGVVSALVAGARKTEEARKKRNRRQMGQALADGYIQTDVVMYPGFSGGALLSGDGAVRGLNTSGFRSGASVSVPAATIRTTVATLLAHGKMKQGYLGVGVQPVRLPAAIVHKVSQETALLVMSVETNSPADAAGLMVGDILYRLDGETTETIDELLVLLQGERVGRTVTADIVRGGETHSLPVTVAERS
jgi:S1-C subfamily serine protease